MPSFNRSRGIPITELISPAKPPVIPAIILLPISPSWFVKPSIAPVMVSHIPITMVNGRNSFPRSLPRPAANLIIGIAVFDAVTRVLPCLKTAEKNLPTGRRKSIILVTT